MALHPLEPAARIINTIGKDLIKDIPAAIVELVKNSYDADASHVTINITNVTDSELQIIIEDDGHGMNKDTILNVWLVPGTDYKFQRKKSPKNRTYQGRKGIGRYATTLLGSQLELISIQDNNETKLQIDWSHFEQAQYLKDILIDVEENRTELNNGTKIIIKGGPDNLNAFNDKNMDKIIAELKKLISPIKKTEESDFNILIKYKLENTKNYADGELLVEPYPIMDYFHYQLIGSIDAEGNATLKYINNYNNTTENIPTFKINLKEHENYCGEIKLDLRVIDRDRDGFKTLLEKFNYAENDYALDINSLRQMLRNSTGVGIYRNSFRIRPHGDPGFDWLNLDKARVQNPSGKIGADQIMGYIEIESEESSNLEEKSARDGLKDNDYYDGLIRMVGTALNELEIRRHRFRNALKSDGKRNFTIQERLENLFDLDTINTEIKEHVQSVAKKIKDDPENAEQFITQMANDVDKKIKVIEKQKHEQYKEIQKIIAIYQNQATLGKIVTVVLHEGRKSLSWFKNQTPRIIKWLNKVKDDENIDNTKFDDALDRLNTTNKEAQTLSKFFDKLDPFTMTRRSKSTTLNLKTLVSYALEIFQEDISKQKIAIVIDIDDDFELYGNKEDFLMCFTNLIENSIFWIQSASTDNPEICIKSKSSSEKIIIEYFDNGPGISQADIETGDIFEPGFSCKVSGTGLGLNIAGEAIKRNNGELQALHSENGVHFVINLKIN